MALFRRTCIRFLLVLAVLAPSSTHATLSQRSAGGSTNIEKFSPKHCPFGSYFEHGKVATIAAAGFTVILRLTNDLERCHYTVRAGAQVLSKGADFAAEVLPSRDLTGDRYPELILVIYSGGAHCCWTYLIATSRPKPAILAHIYNEREIGFEDLDHDGNTELVTLDGAFDYFDDSCHACTAFPLVILRFNGHELTDVSPSHRKVFDEEIAEARAKLQRPELKAELESFRVAKTTKRAKDPEFADARQQVWKIVFDYLYSGRAAEAWKALREMWPAADYNRMKRLILKTRASGILSEIPKSQIANCQSGLR